MANSTDLTVRAQRSRGARIAAPLALAGATLAATVALHYRDPHVEGSWGQCPLNYVLGVDCPGCGGLRAVNLLTNRDLVGAASSNLLFVVSIPLLVGLWFVWLRREWRGERPLRLSTPVVAVLLVTVIGFAVVRNLPFASWLAA
ncbi:DUF2752 domain-containing protein [Nocardioides sp. AE5]|uniref:DUF2752 domain-containing protein n=1 Tax=Nocardioides sp. AE5 TaxID=2962573 RepID=UPI002881F65E|nr:DUF2752 domain-containing protein [Nocardioides sp. AE5]MDT0201288.1 DUF2752 domain-containing protein [Nocardioides sp. AE5]